MTNEGASKPIPVRMRSSGTRVRLASTDSSLAKWAVPTAVGLHFQPVSFGKLAVKITKIRGTREENGLGVFQPIYVCVMICMLVGWHSDNLSHLYRRKAHRPDTKSILGLLLTIVRLM